MRTVKLVLAALALLALLAACGGPAVPETQPTTTEAETTTEAPPRELAEGSVNDVSWRELDLEDEANAEALAWLNGPRQQAREQAESSARPKLADKLMERSRNGVTDILLKDEATGKETLLIAGNGEEGAEWYDPYVEEVIDERFFWYGGTGWEWITPGGIYDMQRMKELPVTFPDFVFALYAGEHDGTRYYSDEIYAEETGQLHVYALPLDLDRFGSAESLEFGENENLLKGIPEADMGETYYYWSLLSDGARYFAVAEESAVRVFDLNERSFVARIPVGLPYFRIAFRDEHTLYCYRMNEEVGDPPRNEIERYALEITLP